MHISRTAGILSAATLLLSAGVAFAEESDTGAPERPNRPEAVRAINAPARVSGEMEKAARARLTATTTLGRLDDVRMMEGREQGSTTRERIESMRATAQERMGEMRTKAQERLADIQDKKRQEKAQQFLTTLENLNTTWTDRFGAQLDRLSALVKKMETRAATAAANGKDVTATNAAIQRAQSVIETARAAVAAQAGKTYAPDLSAVTTAVATSTAQGQSELMKGLKDAFQTAHKALFQDLSALRDGSMTVARKAVQDALEALKQVPGVDEVTASTTVSQ